MHPAMYGPPPPRNHSGSYMCEPTGYIQPTMLECGELAQGDMLFFEWCYTFERR